MTSTPEGNTIAHVVSGTALITQSDPGSENYGIANAQTVLRHALDPTLGDTLQHRWMTNHFNVKPEIFWSQLRRRWSPGFEEVLDRGHLSGLYNPTNQIQRFACHLPIHALTNPDA